MKTEKNYLQEKYMLLNKEKSNYSFNQVFLKGNEYEFLNEITQLFITGTFLTNSKEIVSGLYRFLKREGIDYELLDFPSKKPEYKITLK